MRSESKVTKLASFRLALANGGETPTLLEDSPAKASAPAFGPSRSPSGNSSSAVSLKFCNILLGSAA
jgi:hypothetical protein